MSEKQKLTLGRQSKKYLLLPVVIACATLLASCGGGSDSASTEESADGTKQALAVSGSSAVPPGWTGRAPKMEVINGITVPPEPAPAINNATVAGVDVNNNGVRDDVERFVAKNNPTQQQLASATALAKSYTVIITGTSNTSPQALKVLFEKVICLESTNGKQNPKIAANARENSILAMQFNTPERARALIHFNAMTSQFDPEEVTCE